MILRNGDTVEVEIELTLHQVLLELIVGRLVLQLPHEELREINKMIVRNLEKGDKKNESD